MPLRPSTERRLRQNARSLTALRQLSWMTPRLSASCPDLVLLGTASGSFYSMETALPGQDGASIAGARARSHDLIRSAQRFITDWQQASLVRPTAGPAPWEKPFQFAVNRVAQLAAAVGESGRYCQLAAHVEHQLAAQDLPSVYAHGNFWLGNVLFDADDRVTGVIDWDCTTERALPTVDLIYLLVRTYSLTRHISFGEAIADWIDAESVPLLDDCLARHCRELSIATELIDSLSYCAWIQHLETHCRFGTSASSDARWLDRNVRQVLHRWHARTGSGRLKATRWGKPMSIGRRRPLTPGTATKVFQQTGNETKGSGSAEFARTRLRVCR
jgi:aminoglycoside phosphotransferase (APT) family kinase protein